MRYQLWDQEHGNMVGDFADLAAALALVRAEIAERGRDSALGLALLHVTSDRNSLEPVARGEVLLELSGLTLATP